MQMNVPKNMASDGLLDTNVLVHFLLRDDRSGECREFLALVQAGQRRARLEACVVHELTFVLGRVLKQMTRADIVAYLRQIISWPGTDCDQALLLGALDRWQRPGVAFVDALLITQARLGEGRIFAINAKDVRDADVDVPDPL